MLICYKDKRFSAGSLTVIVRANEIITEYADQGYLLTLRQLYYQFVSRDWLPNIIQSYNRLGSIVNDARLAGMIDWKAIEDRTRAVESNSHWNNPAEIISACASQYQIDKWEGQRYYLEVWIEKEALAGVIEGICRKLDVAYLSCRGYTSQSEMWRSGQRMCEALEDDRQPIIIHLGDHDPSGIDMTRDIQDRLDLFIGYDFPINEIDVRRIALNMDQVKQYKPPPNPAKVTDSRYVSYMKRYGRDSWELDALEPAILTALIEKEVLAYRDDKQWKKMVAKETKHKKAIEGLVSKL